MMELSKFSVCVVIFYFLALCKASETCRKKSVCSCTFNNGSEVNLKPIDGGKTPSFQDINGTDLRIFEWNPCTPFKTDNGCDNTMVCQISIIVDENAGSKDLTEFSVESGNVVVTYGYQTGSTGYKRRSKIVLQCDEKAGKGTIKQFTESKEGGSSTYTATFRSKYACATGGEPLALD
ncbi:uncharacterized protein [Acropora muricata]|uniref:uncharacterized protein n=1 Tax=Acropora muricata TaxID=159855 RepID=UPI0034E590AC